jgi:3-phenylpropionate/trans-cinnamate dioxygenase ferredoxin reductase component
VTDRSHIVVVGSSLAGVRAVEAIRRTGFDARVSLVGAEKHFPPVDRPPLSKKFLRDESLVEPLRIAPDLDIDLRLACGATCLDLSAREVSLDDGSRLSYDGLVVATGATARRLPGTEGLRNVHVLRTLEDAAALKSVLVPGARVAVIGAGVLGCEIAATCRVLGIDVTVIDVFSQPMLRILGPDVAPLLAGLHREHGVRLLLDQQVLGLRGQGEADGVLLEDGEVVNCDLVVVAIGAFPETRWLESSGLDLADGVVCDSECFALGGDRRVVAAGDVARWHHRLLGETLRVEHWTNAVSQGQTAGRNLVAELSGSGETASYDTLPYFWTDQYDWKVQFIGTLGERAHFEEGQPGDRAFVVSYTSGGRLVGALFANRPSRLAAWRKRITENLVESPKNPAQG